MSFTVEKRGDLLQQPVFPEMLIPVNVQFIPLGPVVYQVVAFPGISNETDANLLGFHCIPEILVVAVFDRKEELVIAAEAHGKIKFWNP